MTTTEQFAPWNLDWLLQDLAKSVPQTRHVVVVTADGLCKAKWNTDQETAERIAAGCSGVRSLAAALSEELPPHEDRRLRMAAIELPAGFIFVMDASEGSHLAVLTDRGVDTGLIAHRMRDLVVRLGEHLKSKPRTDGRPG
ncbi:roadblock/LC7 domain-containing protein [Streptomyces sp. YIM 98790]|uniref:roadblock/LC7 domain-containing protein n=1 Tax=Streptomyces sp. YIM 98790 TaxID=2689077 RepID=UPI0028BEE427|nr:roadblock/LC7 domain-containing protein [Streptomyces sp. YIM 98790]